MKIKTTLSAFIVAAFSLLAATKSNAQCVNCPNSDYSITPTATWQYQSDSINSGGCKMHKVAVLEGSEYTFKTGCGDGASANFDTYLELLDSACIQIAYNDDGCDSNHSKIAWIANTSGFVYLKVRGYSSNFGNYNLAYQSCDASASFSYTADSLNPNQISFTDSSQGNIASWSWDFGDSTVSNAPSPNHTYLCGGYFDISLTVTSTNGCTSVAENYLFAESNFIAQFNLVVDSNLVSFFDSSTGNIVGWEWDFGDGTTSNLQNPTHNYTCSGFYYVNLTVTNDNGCTETAYNYFDFIGSSAAYISFTQTGNTVAFTDSSTGNVTSWRWDFGDNSSIDTTQNPTHTYNCAGNYYVYLDITSDSGCTSYANQEIIISGSDTASFEYTIEDRTVTFTETSVGDATAYYWNFDDGNYSNEQNPVHEFGCGDFYVDFSMTTAAGCTYYDYQVISIVDSLTFSAVSNSPVCQGGEIILSAPEFQDGSYVWNGPNGFFSDSISPMMANSPQTAGGVYYATIFSNGCQGTDTLVVTITPVDIAIVQDNVSLSSAATNATFQWINCNTKTPIPTQTNATFIAQSNGSYAVIVDQNSCSDTSQCYTVTNVGINENAIEGVISISPNPSTGVFVLKDLSNKGLLLGAKIEVVNLLGEIVNTLSVTSDKETAIDLSNNNSGIYLLNISTQNGLSHRRLVKE